MDQTNPDSFCTTASVSASAPTPASASAPTSAPARNANANAIQIRPATPADAPSISQLIGSTWAKFFAYSVTEDDLRHYLENTVSEKTIRAEVEDVTRRRFYVAIGTTSHSTPTSAQLPGDATSTSNHTKSEEDALTVADGGPILGVAQLHFPSHTPTGNSSHEHESSLLTPPHQAVELNRLYVHPSQHGTGLAARLLNYAEDEVRAMSTTEGYKAMWLGVWEDNPRGERFYSKMGYERRGEHWFFVGESKRRDWIMEKVLYAYPCK